MEILPQIQSDLLDPTVPLSAILRKAKVLASQLKSEELARWVDRELDGYDDIHDLPDYRRLATTVAGTWTNGYYVVKNRGLSLASIEDDDLRNRLTTFLASQGIREVEQIPEMLAEGHHFQLPAEVAALVNTHVAERGYFYSQLHFSLGAHNFEQMLDTVRNRLLDFVLQLTSQWDPQKSLPAEEDVSQLISVVIHNKPEGGPVTVFDQRGQQVTYQYNAAGNIRIADANSSEDLAEELAKLRAEIERAKLAGVVTEDTAIETQFHLLEASRELEGAKPDQKSILSNIGKARALLDDVAAAAGLVTALVKAAEVVGHVLG